MRREYEKLEQQPLPPFYENLVFWAPLTEGDLTDHISGKQPATSSECSTTFDTARGMYLFDASGSETSYNSAAKYTGLNMGFANGDAITLVADAEEVEDISYGGYHPSMFCTPNLIVESQGFNPARLNTHYFSSSIVQSLHRYCLVCTKKIGSGQFSLTYYQDGIQKYTQKWTAALKLSDNVVNICQLRDNTTKYKVYVKNARIYNRALTAEEVAQL